MKKEDAIRIITKNVDLIDHRIEISKDQRDICIREIIDILLKDQKSGCDEIYSELLRILPQATVSDKALFWKKAISILNKSPDLLERSLGFEETVAGSHGKISLVRNRYNDEALSIFSKVVTDVKAYYLSSFSEACEDVFDNRSEFCVLPTENTNDGKLFGFYSMLDRYELKICAACEIETNASMGNVRYALVGKNIPSRIPRNVKWNLEFSIVADVESFPSSALEAASVFESTLIKIDSLPVFYDDDMRRAYFTFRVPEKFADAFNAFLMHEYSGYTLIGFYPLLK